MTRIICNLFTTDWESKLDPHEMAVKDGIPVVLLAGLQRLSRLAGVQYQEVELTTPSDTMVQAVYSATFIVDDELVRFTGAADCNSKNTKGVFATYPTAIAESRAEARCLRKALGIRTLSAEEIGFREGIESLETKPFHKADKQLIVAIENLCSSREIGVARVLEAVIEDQTRAASIFELSELTVLEAQKAMSWLNEQKPVISTKDARDARKAELKAKQENV